MNSLILKYFQDTIESFRDVKNYKLHCNGCWRPLEKEIYHYYGLSYCSECWRKTKPLLEWIELDCEINEIKNKY